MPPVVDERPVPHGAADGVSDPGKAGPGGQRRGRFWILLAVATLAVAVSVTLLVTGAGLDRPAVSSPAAGHVTAATGGTGLVRVLASGDHVLPGPAVPELNGVVEAIGGLWLTGGNASHSHVLYVVDPATGRIAATLDLPSRLVINPGDIAVGARAVWAAVGGSVYRIELRSLLTGRAVTGAFAKLPDSGFIGDLAVDAGAVWVSDTTSGKVYRFAASTGRLEAVIPVGTTADAMTVGDGGVWVADNDAHTVSRISVARNRVDKVVTIPGVPSHLAASGTGLWVTDGTGSVAAIPSVSPGRVRLVKVDGPATGVAATGNTVWVASTADGTVSRIDARRHIVLATVRVGVRPYALGADSQGVWVALLGRPEMMHGSSPPSQPSATAGLAAWLERLCGVK